MKEIFFSGSDDGGIIGKNARRMMMHLSIPVDDDLQQTLAFFEKVYYLSFQLIVMHLFLKLQVSFIFLLFSSAILCH